MWNAIRSTGKAAYTYITPAAWQQPHAQLLQYPQQPPQHTQYAQQPPQHTQYAQQPPQYYYAPVPSAPKKMPPPKTSVLNPSVVTILTKLTPYDPKGYIKTVLGAKSEEAAVQYFCKVLTESEFGDMVENGKQHIGTSEQSVLIAFFAQMADKYPQYNLCASVTSIIARLG